MLEKISKTQRYLVVVIFLSLAMTLAGIPFGFTGSALSLQVYETENFGYETMGTYWWSGGIENAVVGSIFTMPQSGVAESITVGIGCTDDVHLMTAAIYRVSDWALLGETVEYQCPRSPTDEGFVLPYWQQFDFEEPLVMLDGGLKYALVISAEDAPISIAYIRRDPGTAQQPADYQSIAVTGQAYTGTFPSILPSPNFYNEICSIYCTYTPTGAPTQYTLTVDHTQGGTTTPTKGTYQYDVGTTVTLTATPNQAYKFDWWVVAEQQNTDNPIQVIMDEDKTATATFSPISVDYTLWIGVQGSGTTNPAPGTYTYPAGVQVQVTAIPDSGYLFDYWQLDSTTSTINPVTLTMDTNYDLIAHFMAQPPAQYQLTISTTFGGTTNPPPGVELYDQGASVTVSAIPDSGYHFTQWLLDGTTSTTNPITLTMNQNYMLQAVFEQDQPPPKYTLTITATTGGSVSPSVGDYQYDSGTSVSVTATAFSGSTFIRWELDGVARYENPTDVLMNQDHTLHAYFEADQQQVTLTTSLTPSEAGSIAPAPGTYTYNAGDSVTLTATANQGYRFVKWFVNGNEYSTSSVTITVNTDTVAQAIFEPTDQRGIIRFLGFVIADLGAGYQAYLLAFIVCFVINLILAYAILHFATSKHFATKQS